MTVTVPVLRRKQRGRQPRTDRRAQVMVVEPGDVSLNGFGTSF